MKSCAFEHKIGLETFFTPYSGVGGKLRSIPEDFIVKEHFHYPPKKDDGIYTIAEVFSKN